MAIKQIDYPFRPKSNASLLPGQFWGIPLADGSYGCGRVMQVLNRNERGYGNKRLFLYGLLDWHSNELPTHESIAGAPKLAEGMAHIVAISRCATEILGVRSLESDSLEPGLYLSHARGANRWVLRGEEPLRPAQPGEDFPVCSAWGYRFATLLAERKFLEGKDIVCS